MPRRAAALSPVFFAVASFVSLTSFAVLVDYYYYGGKLTVSSWNIFAYNALGTGDELYGTEPAAYYVKNLFVNFNGVACLMLLSFPLLAMRMPRNAGVAALHLSPLLLWFLVMFPRPHKEERFLFPVYHLVAFSAAVAVDSISSFVPTRGFTRRFFNVVTVVTILTFGFISTSRSYALSKHYGAPVKLYTKLYNRVRDRPSMVCVGGEWHRSVVVEDDDYCVLFVDKTLSFLRHCIRQARPFA